MSEPLEPEATAAMFDQLFQQFNQLCQQRLGLINAIPDDPDEMLADIANMAALLYSVRKVMPQLPQLGFQPFDSSSKEKDSERQVP